VNIVYPEEVKKLHQYANELLNTATFKETQSLDPKVVAICVAKTLVDLGLCNFSYEDVASYIYNEIIL